MTAYDVLLHKECILNFTYLHDQRIFCILDHTLLHFSSDVDLFCLRELGVVSMFITTLVPAYFAAMNEVAAEAARKLAELSKIVERLTEQLPDAETVRGVFLPEGSKTGSQFRYEALHNDCILCSSRALAAEL